jgi:hypothetical protein
MQDNFDIHGWNRNNALKEIQEDQSSSDKIYNRLLSWFEKQKDESERYRHAYEIFKEMGNYIKMEIVRANLFESMDENSNDPIDAIVTDVPLFLRLLEYSREDAQTDMDLHTLTENAVKQTKIQGVLSMEDYNILVGDNQNPLKETINTVMENLEGFSDYFPGGKTKGLTTDELSTILMKIVKDIEKDGKELDESTLTEDDRCTRIAKRKYDSWPSAYASGAVVRCRRGDIWKDIKG